MVALDGREWPLQPGEEERLRRLAPRLNGRVRIDELNLPAAEGALVARLRSAGAIYDLPLEDDSVRTRDFCDYLIVENFHFVRAASIRQSPLLSVASSKEFNLIRGFVTEEANHENYFLETLTRWGLSAEEVRSSVPLASTSAFIGLQYRLAHKSPLDYLAGSAVLEVDPQVYADRGDPYQSWIDTYGIDPEVLAPVREHIKDMWTHYQGQGRKPLTARL